MDELINGPSRSSGGTPWLQLATVGSATSAGATLKLDGESAAGTKRYKVLSGVTISAGDRVVVAGISGSYVVLGKIAY